ncbi:MAG: glycoside hydrolase family 2 TIM barrel-domain containing protein [Gillisia sp.]
MVKPTVYIQKTDDGYKLMRNGKPYYMYGGAAHGNYLEELKEAGANTARIYDTINLSTTLDKAAELGLAAVVDIPMPKFNNAAMYYEDEALFRLIKANVERVVKKHKDHPALLYWNLGNELYYPYFYTRTVFFERFNILIDLIHDLDPNHPVSTVTIGANKLRVLSINRKSPQLDFISFNSFGTLSKFAGKLKPISPIWDGPHVITEWGVNGPWEAKLTQWHAPIEETSTKKAEQIAQRYHDYIVPLKSNNSLGSFVFYWGQKNEITPTWYSLFTEDHMKTQPVFELMKIWRKNFDTVYPGPEVDYIFLNGKGALDNIILEAGSLAEVEIFLPEKEQKNLEYHWEIRQESWYNFHESILVDNIDFQISGEKARFNTPVKEGPYRAFLYISNGSDYIATANIPFYVLSTEDGE